MYTSADKNKTRSGQQENRSQVPVERDGVRLEDNRSRSQVQLKKKTVLSDQQTIQKKENNTGLPDQLKSGIENLSGHSMDDVKVHYNSSQPAQLNAHAYAQGNQIHVAPGQERHLPHEAWHVVQQKQGRVKTTKQLKGKTNINDDAGLEKEADVMGAKAVQAKAGTSVSQLKPIIARGIVQMKKPFDDEGEAEWDSTVERLQNELLSEYGEEVEMEEIEEFLENSEEIENPRGHMYELDNQDELDSYLSELGSVEVKRLYKYLYGGSESDEEEPKKPLFKSEDEEEPIPTDEELHYSSEDDEVPANKEHFDRVVNVVIELNKLLNRYLSSAKGVNEFKVIVEKLVQNIKKHKEKHGTKKFPENFNPVSLASLQDFNALAVNIREAKGSKRKEDTKPTSFNYNFPVWKGSKTPYIKFRGKQLKNAEGGEGRTWAAISLSLHELAQALGKVLASTAAPGTQQNVGNRVLAMAIIHILAGRGDEVGKSLVENYKLPGDVIKQFEGVVAEFLALTAGVENIRMPFTQLDTVLHLSNIASGSGFGPDGKPYDFLNVFSSVRHDKEGPKYVYTRGRYRWKQDKSGKEKVLKELTRYRGQRKTKLQATLLRPKMRGQRVSAKSEGKSGYTHSAGHGKVEKLFKGDKKIIGELWRQVRPLGKKEDRRKVHEQRLYVMGPLRLYNLFANLISKHEKELSKCSPEQIARFIMEAYISYVEGTRPDGKNPFHSDFITIASPDFETSVFNVLQDEEATKVDEESIKKVEALMNANNTKEFEALYMAFPKEFKRVMAAIVHSDPKKGAKALHMAIFSNNLAIVYALIGAGVDIDAEFDGKTALAFAIEHKREEIVKWLVELEEKRSKHTKLPSGWSNFQKPKKGGNWLDDQEVRTRLTQKNLGNTHITPAVNIAEHPDVLASFIRDNYLHQMGTGNVATHTIVPINFNNAHWATLVIQQNPARRSQPLVYFFDSMGSSQRKLNLIRNMLRATGVYTNTDNINDLSAELQEDGYTCGTWLIESAAAIVNGLQNNHTLPVITLALQNLQQAVNALHVEHIRVSREKSKEQKDDVKMDTSDNR